MCDYRIESKKALAGLPLPKVRGYLGQTAHNKLLQVVKSGRARPGHDLHDGKLLPNGSLLSGHYMSDSNFHRTLAKMNAQPHRCQWCGGALPTSLVRQHQQPHDHREHIQHHFHPECWRARLLAVAAIFGHVRPEQLLARGTSQKRHGGLRETITVTVKKVFTLNRRPQNGKWRKWRS
jgi:hypothetical protein